ncbi:MAG TPA: acyltransferase [Candidatus Sulfotelmatobacter sp.]|nr:acyltransferase [Candidatus Sulfotelmatobacter sp.]
MNRIPSLDGLRAIAISLVVLGHWAELQCHSDVAGAYASLGRRMFFVLSGYLITTLLMKEYGKNATIRLRRFYVRRAYRILPAAIAFMMPVFLIFWRETRWYHMAAALLYVVNFDFTHPWFLGHLWSVSVQEQFYFLWPSVLRKWHRRRVVILVGVIAFAPVYRVACHFAGLHGRADETFLAVADILAIGCLLALFEAKMPKIRGGWALLMCVPVVLVPVYMGAVHFRTTPGLLVLFWPALHFSIAGLLLHVVQSPYRILNVPPLTWLGRISYGLYLWQQLFVFGQHARPWYNAILAVAMATASYHLLEQPVLRMRDRRTRVRRVNDVLVPAA